MLKIIQKHPKILSKSTPNPPKIDKETKNMDPKSDADLRCAKKAKKVRKSGPRAPQKDCRQKLDGIREASSEGGEAPPKGGWGGRLVNSRSTRWGVEDPRALGRSAGLRETARGSWHRKSSQNLPKISQNPSKDLPEPSNIDPKLIQKASWTPF